MGVDYMMTDERMQELLKELSIIDLTDLLMAKAVQKGQNCRIRITTPRPKKTKKVSG